MVTPIVGTSAFMYGGAGLAGWYLGPSASNAPVATFTKATTPRHILSNSCSYTLNNGKKITLVNVLQGFLFLKTAPAANSPAPWDQSGTCTAGEAQQCQFTVTIDPNNPDLKMLQVHAAQTMQKQ